MILIQVSSSSCRFLGHHPAGWRFWLRAHFNIQEHYVLFWFVGVGAENWSSELLYDLRKNGKQKQDLFFPSCTNSKALKSKMRFKTVLSELHLQFCKRNPKSLVILISFESCFFIGMRSVLYSVLLTGLGSSQCLCCSYGIGPYCFHWWKI